MGLEVIWYGERSFVVPEGPSGGLRDWDYQCQWFASATNLDLFPCQWAKWEFLQRAECRLASFARVVVFARANGVSPFVS